MSENKVDQEIVESAVEGTEPAHTPSSVGIPQPPQVKSGILKFTGYPEEYVKKAAEAHARANPAYGAFAGFCAGVDFVIADLKSKGVL